MTDDYSVVRSSVSGAIVNTELGLHHQHNVKLVIYWVYLGSRIWTILTLCLSH